MLTGLPTSEIIQSNGLVKNIFAIYKRPKIQLGIVESNVLAFGTKSRTSDTEPGAQGDQRDALVDGGI